MLLGMGEQTSKYDSMTPARIAATLTTPMINALDTGRNDDGTACVLGTTGTVVALIRRGLVTVGRENRWTARGFAVAALVLYGDVPSRPHAVAYDGKRGVVGAQHDAHVLVANVPGTSLGEMREAFVVRHYMGDDLLDACGLADRDAQLVVTPVVEDVTCTPCGQSGFELCNHPRLVPRYPCAACAPRYAAEAERSGGEVVSRCPPDCP